MAFSESRTNMLRKIRKALSRPTAAPFLPQDTQGKIYPDAQDDLSVVFATEFTKLLGKFAYCADDAELAQQLRVLIRETAWASVYCPDEQLQALFQENGLADMPYTKNLPDCDVSITTCEALVARTGSILLSAAQKQGRTSSVYAPVHICIARTSQLVYDISDAMAFLKSKYGSNLPSALSFATGPSRTADIEKTLVVGVHGPKDVFCFLVED